MKQNYIDANEYYEITIQQHKDEIKKLVEIIEADILDAAKAGKLHAVIEFEDDDFFSIEILRIIRKKFLQTFDVRLDYHVESVSMYIDWSAPVPF